MTLDRWMAQHPYLEPIARLDADVDREIDGMPLRTAAFPVGIATSRTMSRVFPCWKARLRRSTSRRWRKRSLWWPGSWQRGLCPACSGRRLKR